MWNKIFKKIETKSNDNQNISRRRFPRRSYDTCVIQVENTTYPVKDWSQCGVLFQADGRNFVQGQNVPVILKFRLLQSVIELPLSAQVVRISASLVALEFQDISDEIADAFDRVIKTSEAMQKSEGSIL
jgi:hypothetical protein